jgi:hypothetical protein
MTAATPAHEYAHVTLTLQIKDGVSYADVVEDLFGALDKSTHWQTSDPGLHSDMHKAESLGQRFRSSVGHFTMPDHAEVIRDSNNSLHLLLDGIPFPYAVERDSLTATPTVGRGPDAVSLDLIVGRVTITDTPKETTP